MEELTSNSTVPEVQVSKNSSGIIIPSHSNMMAMSIICTIFCCIIGGIIAIVNSSSSNSLYNSAILTENDDLKQSLLLQSEAKNRTAKIWIIISLVPGVLLWVIMFFGVIIAGV